MTDLRLATTIDEMYAKFENFRTAEGKAISDAFVPDSKDIIISPYAKSGTTWTQQIVHSLRTRGDMDFAEITEVIPWISMAYDLGIDIHAPQKASPRAFKSHASWEQIQKGARYIYVVRNPKDVVVSEYLFIGDWIIDTAAVSIVDFVQAEYLHENGYWKHVNSWWSQFDNPDVLFLCFEDMKVDLDRVIRQIASFIHIELDDELFEIVRKNASFDFMKAHQQQFDDHLLRDARNHAMELPTDTTATKVHAGTIGKHKQHLPPELSAEFDARWAIVTNPEYGLTGYDVVREKIQKRKI